MEFELVQLAFVEEARRAKCVQDQTRCSTRCGKLIKDPGFLVGSEGIEIEEVKEFLERCVMPLTPFEGQSDKLEFGHGNIIPGQ
jgi:hypothetical protein